MAAPDEHLDAAVACAGGRQRGGQDDLFAGRDALGLDLHGVEGDRALARALASAFWASAFWASGLARRAPLSSRS